MVTRRKDPEPSGAEEFPRRPPATTPQAREQQLVAIAYDLAEERMLNKKASSQEIIHFLKLGTENAQLEREKLRTDNDLSQARKEQIGKNDRTEELLERAIRAFKGYSGEEVPPDDGQFEQ